MTKKWLLALAIFGASVAGAKSFDITMPFPTIVGNVQLAPGEYQLKVESSRAVFTDQKTNKSVEANVTLENSSRKYNYTAVETKRVGGKDRINTIELGGTTTKLEFN